MTFRLELPHIVKTGTPIYLPYGFYFAISFVIYGINICTSDFQGPLDTNMGGFSALLVLAFFFVLYLLYVGHEIVPRVAIISFSSKQTSCWVWHTQ